MPMSQMSATPPAGTLELRVENREPVPLRLLAATLTALSGDYQSLTGRDLILLRIEQGSIIAQLADWAASANDLIDFGKSLGGFMAVAGGGFLALRSRRRKGSKTILAVAELAAKSGGEVKIRYRSKDGETLFVDMKPETGRIILNESVAKKPTRRPSRELPHEPAQPQDASRADRNVSSLSDFLVAAADRGLSAQDEDDGLLFLLVEVIRALRERSDGQQVIDRVRQNLSAGGRKRALDLFDELLRK